MVAEVEVGGREREREEQLDQVVYYYDVATIWIRPVDLKVCVGVWVYFVYSYFFSFTEIDVSWLVSCCVGYVCAFFSFVFSSLTRRSRPTFYFTVVSCDV